MRAPLAMEILPEVAPLHRALPRFASVRPAIVKAPPVISSPPSCLMTSVNTVARRLAVVSPGLPDGTAQEERWHQRKSTGTRLMPSGPGRAIGSGTRYRTSLATGHP